MKQELLAAVGLAKSRVDAGFSRVGRRLKAEDVVDRTLMALAARAIAAGNAVMTLAQNGHANEALPLLRAAAEWSLALRWVSAADSAGRAEQAWAELSAASWSSVFDDARAKERAAEYGVPAWAVEPALGSAPDFALGNAQGLPWGHALDGKARPGRKPEAVLAAAAAWLALALEGLDRRWPGDFPGAAEIRDRAQISRGQ